MERDYIGHIYQIRYGVLKHMLEKLLDGIFHWASSIKVIFMEACRWRSAIWKWNRLGFKVLLAKPMQPQRANFHVAIRLDIKKANKFLGEWLQVASLAWPLSTSTVVCSASFIHSRLIFSLLGNIFIEWPIGYSFLGIKGIKGIS